MRRRSMLALLVALVALLGAALAPAVAAADPTLYVAATRRDASGTVFSINPITDRKGTPQPPLLLPGEYVIVTGLGFPANQPVQATLVAGGQTYPLAYRNLTTPAATPQSPPQTDASGVFQDLAFALPATGQVRDTSGQLVVSVGSVALQTPVSIVTEAATTAGSGDWLAVGFGAAFFIVAAVLLLLMLRGLPEYPRRERRASAREKRA